MAADAGARLSRIAKQGEAVFLAFLLLVALILLAETFRFRSVPWDSLGMAFWPRLQLGLLVAAILTRFWHLRLGGTGSLSRFWQGIGVLVDCIGYVGATVALGIYLATPPFFLLFAALRPTDARGRCLVEGLAASAVVLLAIWLLFDVAMGLRMMSLPFWLR